MDRIRWHERINGRNFLDIRPTGNNFLRQRFSSVTFAPITTDLRRTCLFEASFNPPTVTCVERRIWRDVRVHVRDERAAHNLGINWAAIVTHRRSSFADYTRGPLTKWRPLLDAASRYWNVTGLVIPYLIAARAETSSLSIPSLFGFVSANGGVKIASGSHVSPSPIR